MEELSAKELFNTLAADRAVRLQVPEAEVAALHSRLCKFRAAADADFKQIGESNPLFHSEDQIACAKLSFQHLEDGTKLCIVEFKIVRKQVRRYQMISMDDAGDCG